MATTRKFNGKSKAKIVTPYEGTAEGADATGTAARDQLIRFLAHSFGPRTSEGLAAPAPYAGSAGNIDNARVFGAIFTEALSKLIQNEDSGIFRLPLAASEETKLANCTSILTRIDGSLRDRDAAVDTRVQLPYMNDDDMRDGIKHALYYAGLEKFDLSKQIESWGCATREAPSELISQSTENDPALARTVTEISYGLKALRMIAKEYELIAQRTLRAQQVKLKA